MIVFKRLIAISVILLSLLACGGQETEPTPLDVATSKLDPTSVPTTKPAPTAIPVPTATATPSKSATKVEKSVATASFTYSLEKIPGSLNHSPDSTWWGYNQSKIARYGDTVFTYVVQNDNDPGTKTPMTLYKKVGEGPWEKGAS